MNDRITQTEAILREWLADPAIAIVCGDWRAGSIMELLPDGPVLLAGQRYADPFSGLRDVRLAGQRHHLHVDLSKLESCVYAITPSVCYAYRPAFEVGFATALGTMAFSISLREPYHGAATNRAPLVRYFQRLLRDHVRFPDLVRFRVERSAHPHAGESWRDALTSLMEASGRNEVAHDGPAAPEDIERTLRALILEGRGG
jgi:hypothetical protein